jgi:aryl-alcohol dehydrogenase-like predicted oxidoreductase
MALCLGTAQLGQSYGPIRKISKDTAYSVLGAAIDEGIEYIDTAPVYGEAETIIGNFFRSNPVQVKIITKIPKYKGKDPKEFIDHCKGSAIQSMRNLGRGRVWGVLLHDAQNPVDFPDEVMGLRAWFIATGIVTKFGVSLYEPSDIHHRMMGLYQIPMNLKDTRFIRELPKDDFFWNGNTIMVRSIYLQGKIEDHHKALGFVKTAIEKYTRHNLIVVGCEKPEQVKENAEIYRNDAPVGATEYSEIMTESLNSNLQEIDPRKWK